jgi:hypothetical protein
MHSHTIEEEKSTRASDEKSIFMLHTAFHDDARGAAVA